MSGWFDTEIGGKREADSYRRIVRSIGVPMARSCSCPMWWKSWMPPVVSLQTRLIDRRDDYPMPRTGQAANGHERVENFQQIQL